MGYAVSDCCQKEGGGGDDDDEELTVREVRSQARSLRLLHKHRYRR
jgi:hypothetical protein